MKSALLSALLLFTAGVILLAGCVAAGSSQANTSNRNVLLARLRASEKKSQQIEAWMVTTQQRLAASYPTGTVTALGETVGQNAATDELATKLQGLRARLEKFRQEQQKLRAQLRHAA